MGAAMSSIQYGCVGITQSFHYEQADKQAGSGRPDPRVDDCSAVRYHGPCGRLLI
jgi:hypothetical protein